MRLSHTRFLAVVGLSLALVLVLGACAPAPTPVPPTSVPPPPSPANAPAPAPAVGLAAAPVALQMAKHDKLGNLVADGDGRTLYLFTKDTPNTSTCYDTCAQSWPAVIPADKPALKEGLNSALIGTTDRKDGSKQLTYNGWPLYYYAKDLKAGDVNGQGVGKFWWVVSGEGNMIKPAALSLAAHDKFGKFLADDAGRSLYTYTPDGKNQSNCYDKCEQNWPPLLQLDKPTLGDGIDSLLLGTAMRKDGTTQVTYNGMPLYYYIKDAKPGDVNGQGVGSVWYVLGTDGNVSKTAP